MLANKQIEILDAEQSIANTNRYVDSLNPREILDRSQATRNAQLKEYASRLAAAEKSVASTSRYVDSLNPGEILDRSQAARNAQMREYGSRLAAAEKSIARAEQLRYAEYSRAAEFTAKPLPAKAKLALVPLPQKLDLMPLPPKGVTSTQPQPISKPVQSAAPTVPYPDGLTRRPRPITAPAVAATPRVPNAAATAGRLGAQRGAAAAARGAAAAAGRGVGAIGGRVVGAFGGPVGVAATVGPEIKKVTDNAFDQAFPALAPYRQAAWSATPIGMAEAIQKHPYNPLNPFGKLWDWAPWNQKGPNSLNPNPTTSSPAIDPNGFWPVENPPETPIWFRALFKVDFYTLTFTPQGPSYSGEGVQDGPFPGDYSGGRVYGIPLGWQSTSSPSPNQYSGPQVTWTFRYLASDGTVQNTGGASFSSGPANGRWTTIYGIPQPGYAPEAGDSSLGQNQAPVEIDPYRQPNPNVEFAPPMLEPEARPEYQPEPYPQPYPNPATQPQISPQGTPYVGASPLPQNRPSSVPKPNIAQPNPIPNPEPKPQPDTDASPDGLPRYNPFARPFAPGTASGTGTVPEPTIRTSTSTVPQPRPAFEPWPAPQPKPVQEMIYANNPEAEPKPKPEPEKPAPKEDLCKDPCISDMHNTSKGQKPTEITYKVFKKCGENGPEFENKTMDVPGDEAEAIKALLDDIADRKAEKCDRQDGTLTIPEWWAVRPGADRPQFVIMFAEIYGTGKLGKSRWQLTIPHYNRPKGAKPSIPKYRKGNWQGTLTLTDNSKIRINAATASEAKRVINKLKILIPVQYRTVNGKAIKPTILERADGDMKECDVTPIRGDYYKTGQRQNLPDWSVNFR
jgi:hypothetical protein